MSKPKIRFKGYEEDWEQRKLGEVAKYRRGSFPQPYGNKEWYGGDGAMPFVQVADVTDEMNLVTDTKLKISKKAQPMSVYAEKNSVLVTLQGSIGRVAITQYGAFVDRTVLIFEEYNEQIDNAFWAYIIKQKFIEEARKAPGGTIKTITKEALSGFDLTLPSYDEQVKLGIYFQSLDSLITLHQRKCEETKKLKKYMLQKMFPQNGKRVPEIRFAGFTDDWEQRKLGDVTELKSASRVHKGEWTDSGVPFFRSSDVMAAINGTTNEKAYISEELYEKLSNASGKLEEGDVLVTGGGSVGNPYIVPNSEPLYTKDADLLWIKNQGRFYPYFLYEYFFSPTFRIYLSSISHVGTIAHYTITQLSETPISLPDIEEQIKVGEYFESLDRLITLHQRKYEELQKIKKFMLQNMFI